MCERFLEEELFEKVEIFDGEALFTDSRLRRENIPEELYVYELRESDELSGDPRELKRRIYVNFFGTVISKTPLLEEEEDSKFMTYDDWGYTGEESTIKDFLLEETA